MAALTLRLGNHRASKPFKVQSFPHVIMGDQRSFLHFPGREPSPTLVCEGARSGLRPVIAGLGGGAAAASVARDRKELEAPQ